MSSFTRKVSCFRILKEVKNARDLPNHRKYKTIGLFVPELVYVTLAIKDIKKKLGNKSYFEDLFTLLDELKKFNNSKERGGLGCRPGVVPLKGEAAERFVKTLYNKMAEAGIPLPAPIEFEELKFWSKTDHQHWGSPERHSFVVSFNKPKVSFVEWLFPMVGFGVSLVLVMGLSASSAVTILSWGWPGWVLFFCISAKLTANYVDIQGGPENRLRRTAEFFKRLASGLYIGRGQWSAGKLLLYGVVSLILAASAYVSWFYAFGTLRNLHWLNQLGDGVIYYMANIFAGSMFYSSFGRLFNPLYQKLYPHFEAYFDLSEVDQNYCFISRDVSHVKELYRDAKKIKRTEMVEILDEITRALYENEHQTEHDKKWLKKYVLENFEHVLRYRDGMYKREELQRHFRDYKKHMLKKPLLESSVQRTAQTITPLFNALQCGRAEIEAIHQLIKTQLTTLAAYHRFEIDANVFKQEIKNCDFSGVVATRANPQQTLNALMHIVRPLLNKVTDDRQVRERLEFDLKENFHKLLFEFQPGQISRERLDADVSLNYTVISPPPLSPPTL